MFTPLILFFGLTIATAVIAYWSDNLGKKLGKKRVSLLGLRPRTTATILTISSSWAIMLFTLGVLLAVVTPLRNALFLYDRERDKYEEDRTRYQQDTAAAQKRLTGTESQLSRTESSLATAKGNLLQSQSALREATADVEEASANVKKAQTNAKQAQAGEKQAQAGAKTAQRRAEAAQRRENRAQRGEQKAEQLEKEARRALNESRDALQQIQSKFDQTQTRLNDTQTRLRNVQQRLQEASGLATRVGRLTIQTGKQTVAAQREVYKLARQRASLQKEVKDLEVAAQLFLVAGAQLAGGDVKIGVGKTFAARTIAARESVDNVEAQLGQILADGEAAFARKPETAALYQQGARLILLPPSGRSATSAPVLRSWAQLIASNGATTSVRLVAAFNSTSEEKQIVAVSFVEVPVAVAFRSGEILASAIIDNAGGDAHIFGALYDLIEVAREAAVRRKVNPPQSLDEPDFYATGTNVSLFEALRRIQASGRAKRVRLVAAQDLSSVEPLRVRFEVEDAPAS